MKWALLLPEPVCPWRIQAAAHSRVMTEIDALDSGYLPGGGDRPVAYAKKPEVNERDTGPNRSGGNG